MDADSQRGGNGTVQRQHFWRRRLPGGHFGPQIASGSPFAPMAQLSGRIERVMDSFFDHRVSLSSAACAMPVRGSEGAASSEPDRAVGSTPEWSPNIDVRQGTESIFISVDLPGVHREDLRIEADGEAIAISGERHPGRTSSSDDAAGCRYQVMECNHGGFRRVIPLPQSANVEAARAGMRAGVLEITIPLLRGRPPKLIEVELY